MRIINETISMTLEGVIYYDRYDDQLLTVFIVFTNVIWIIFVSYTVINITSFYKEIKALRIYSFQYALLSLLAGVLLTKGKMEDNA